MEGQCCFGSRLRSKTPKEVVKSPSESHRFTQQLIDLGSLETPFVEDLFCLRQNSKAVR